MLLSLLYFTYIYHSTQSSSPVSCSISPKFRKVGPRSFTLVDILRSCLKVRWKDVKSSSNADQNLLGSGPTSCEILGESPEIYPHTLEDIEQIHGQGFQHNKTLELRQTQALPSILANCNRGALITVMTPYHLHSKLPDLRQDSTLDHDVYLAKTVIVSLSRSSGRSS